MIYCLGGLTDIKYLLSDKIMAILFYLCPPIRRSAFFLSQRSEV